MAIIKASSNLEGPMKNDPSKDLMEPFSEEQRLSKQSIQAHPSLMLIGFSESKDFGIFACE